MITRLQRTLALTMLLTLPAAARGQAETARAELIVVAALRPPGIVAATVAGKPVDVSEVNRVVKIAVRGRPVSKAALPGLEAQALEQVINRKLVQLFLDAKKVSVTEAEIDKTIAEREKEQRTVDADLADVRGQNGLTVAAYRDEVDWELRWAKYLASLLNDKQLEAYFNANRQEFDGTELRISHILLRPDGALDPEEVDTLKARAETIRDEILGELTSFEDAAKRYSGGPSRQKGGDIGFISRHGVMPEEFSRAAFALEKEQISIPVVTHLGVHLIQCTDVRVGTKTWRDVRKEMRPSAVQNVFAQLAQKMREATPIEYTGAVSHIDPETGILIEGTGKAKAADKPDEEK